MTETTLEKVSTICQSPQLLAPELDLSPSLASPVPAADDWDWAQARRACLRETRRILRCPSAAEDAAQEALLRAWKRRRSCRHHHDPQRWLAQIARREALRELADQGRTRETQLPDDTGPSALAAPDTLEDLFNKLGFDSLVENLSLEDRELVRLRYVDDLTYRQVANHLGIPEGTAKVRLHRLRTRLQRDLRIAQ